MKKKLFPGGVKMKPIDKEQNLKIAWCEKLLYAMIILQFPQLANLI